MTAQNLIKSSQSASGPVPVVLSNASCTSRHPRRDDASTCSAWAVRPMTQRVTIGFDVRSSTDHTPLEWAVPGRTVQGRAGVSQSQASIGLISAGGCHLRVACPIEPNWSAASVSVHTVARWRSLRRVSRSRIPWRPEVQSQHLVASQVHRPGASCIAAARRSSLRVHTRMNLLSECSNSYLCAWQPVALQFRIYIST
jgi:hypothetical protein